MESVKVPFDTPLCELAYKYGTDKCPQINHGYTPYYYELLKDVRESTKKVLELGIGTRGTMGRRAPKQYVTGASLFMWRDFFPNAQVYGADFMGNAMFEADRIETILCDEREEAELTSLMSKVGSDVDLFVDDGSHAGCHQHSAAVVLLPLMKKDVLYIIEDVYHPRQLSRGLRRLGYETETVLCRNVLWNKDEAIVIVKNR